ncbi:hypothetical protein O6H91_03G056600 [Diphasiastrum complanatum]|uniref:Uncharacterized protein n=1 Tax=Diphasiastrum complanatum TaxID=34168 RepID=A0ACC2E6N8_DIPCM|nr:hypothetical protein O6H91_03G056600 [Diphasiastrum complanatum]
MQRGDHFWSRKNVHHRASLLSQEILLLPQSQPNDSPISTSFTAAPSCPQIVPTKLETIDEDEQIHRRQHQPAGKRAGWPLPRRGRVLSHNWKLKIGRLQRRLVFQIKRYAMMNAHL